jgi:heme A synthase
MARLSRFALFAWGNLAYNLFVILWGAFVRASGSGAGCGDHWPLCNGEIIPRAEAIETLIEFTHRATSGIALLLVIGLIVWAFRAYPKGHIVRRGAAFSFGFMVTEALLGAGLVLFQLVADNESIARVYSIAAHLVNTFLLVAALALTAWWASGFAPPRLRGQGPLGFALLGGLLTTLIIGVTGAVIALGDTLFFAYINRGGSEATLTPFVEGLTQLRLVHPVVAVLGSIVVGVLAWQTARVRPGQLAVQLAWGTTILIAIQLLVGVLNVYLKVPIAIQLIHLLLADLIWITLVVVSANALAESQPETVMAQPRATARSTSAAESAH